jgi:hypothetical protein
VLTPEQVYHVFVVSLLLGLQPRYLVRSNRESGTGRYDVMVLPRGGAAGGGAGAEGEEPAAARVREGGDGRGAAAAPRAR